MLLTVSPVAIKRSVAASFSLSPVFVCEMSAFPAVGLSTSTTAVVVYGRFLQSEYYTDEQQHICLSALSTALHKPTADLYPTKTAHAQGYEVQKQAVPFQQWPMVSLGQMASILHLASNP